MTEARNRQVVERLWQRLDMLEWQAAGDLVHEDAVFEWPQTRERIRGRENFIGVNENYPGTSRIDVRRVMSTGSLVVSEVWIDHDRYPTFAISFFELEDGRIRRATEYWAEPYDPPPGREQWVERY